MNQLAFNYNDTAFEFDRSVEAVVQPAPDIAVAAEAFKSRIESTLITERTKQDRAFEKSSPSTATNGQLVGRLRDRIDSAVQATFPHFTPRSQLSLQPLQEWEGYVIEIGDETFSARLVDTTAHSTSAEEVADFPLSDISDADRSLLEVGAVFRWVIGYQRSIGGTKRRVSQVTFRRMPAWTRREIQLAHKRAKELLTAIEWE